MKFIKSVVGTCVIAGGMAIPAMASSPDIYIVAFVNDRDAKSQLLKKQLQVAIAISGVEVDKIICDTSTAAKWEKCAHNTFDRDIVPVFNQWIGLPGFAAVVDAKSKRVIGCVNSKFDANEMASEIRKMAARARGTAYKSHANYEFSPNESYILKASVSSKTTRCPAAHNKDPGR